MDNWKYDLENRKQFNDFFDSACFNSDKTLKSECTLYIEGVEVKSGVKYKRNVEVKKAIENHNNMCNMIREKNKIMFKEMLKQQGLSVLDVAKKINVNSSSLRQFHSNGNASKRTLELINERFNLDLKYSSKREFKKRRLRMFATLESLGYKFLEKYYSDDVLNNVYYNKKTDTYIQISRKFLEGYKIKKRVGNLYDIYNESLTLDEIKAIARLKLDE